MMEPISAAFTIASISIGWAREAWRLRQEKNRKTDLEKLVNFSKSLPTNNRAREKYIRFAGEKIEQLEEIDNIISNQYQKYSNLFFAAIVPLNISIGIFTAIDLQGRLGQDYFGTKGLDLIDIVMMPTAGIITLLLTFFGNNFFRIWDREYYIYLRTRKELLLFLKKQVFNRVFARYESHAEDIKNYINNALD